MKFTLSWIKQFLTTEASLAEITAALDQIGLEVEEVIDRREEFANFIVAEIMEAKPHPEAEKLQICLVNNGKETLQIVCGAPNARTGVKVVLAPIGAIIPNGKFAIKKAEIRGVASNGMMCSEQELLVGKDTNGIIELPASAVPGESFLKYYGLDDPVIEISVTPNRGDCLSVYGVARELAAYGLGQLKMLASIVEDSNLAATDFTVTNLEPELCASFAYCELKNLENCSSPVWLKNLLTNIGMEPISAIVDITNYIAISYGRPLHAYDRNKLKGNLTIAMAKDGEEFLALNGKKYLLNTNDLVVRDTENIQSLAGIIGGELSACDMTTTNIILEAALFAKDQIAMSGRRHNIDTDARYRFERKTDPMLVEFGIFMAAKKIQEICGGSISGIKKTAMIEVANASVTITEEFFHKKTALALPLTTMQNILDSLGFSTKIIGETLEATPPSWRHDISIPEDLVEEIVRIYGFDKVPATPIAPELKFRLMPKALNRQIIAKRVLAARGFNEVATWSFMNSKFVEPFSTLNSNLQLQNPISSELDYMRPSIIPNLLLAVSKNLFRSMPNLSLFEVGPIFMEDEEQIVVTAIRTGKAMLDHLHSGTRAVDIFDIKADLEVLLKELELPFERLQLVTTNLPAFLHPTRSAIFTLGKNQLGFFGEVHPETLQQYNITQPIAVLNLALDLLPETRSKFGRKENFTSSLYQPVSRDFAVVVDATQAIGPILNYVNNIDKKIIKNVDAIDVYRGDKMAVGKKSLAFRVTMQAVDHTLADNEITALTTLILNQLASKFGAVLRGQERE